ncbi:ALG-4 protein [Aphelenchoides avenae]|nr:ALG-4 protein [Aphelenchus avenae]
MIRASTGDAPQRKERILSLFQQADFRDDPFLQTFGLSVSTEMIQTVGRVLTPPAILYRKNNRCDPIILPHDGAWSMDNQELYLTAKCRSYSLIGMVNLREQSLLQGFRQAFHQQATKTGFEFPSAQISSCEVKECSDTLFCILSQRVQLKTAQRPRPATCANFAPKINSGGRVPGSEYTVKNVLREDQLGIKMAYSMLPPDYKPQITFIVVQKRHHGTSRPARYHVLWDDSKFSSDEVQPLPFAMCHTSAAALGRCQAPVYYADLVATRACYLIKSKMYMFNAAKQHI